MRIIINHSLAILMTAGATCLYATPPTSESQPVTADKPMQTPTVPANDDRESLPDGLNGTWIEDFTIAQQLASQHGVPILADFTGSDWCGWCMKLNAEVFDTEEFRTWASSQVVLLKLDFPMRRDQEQAIAKQNRHLQATYQVRSYPTVLLLDRQGGVLRRWGYAPGGFDAWVQGLIGDEAIGLRKLQP